jgi:hypothetical protein
MTRIVISQPMYFPWVGLLEQVKLADIFVHYDDVQYTRGFYNRVQIKTAAGPRWLTVPLRDWHRGQHINQVLIDDRVDWRREHKNSLIAAYRGAPFLEDLLSVVNAVFDQPAVTLSDISRGSVNALADYFGLGKGRMFVNASDLGIEGRSSQRLHDIVRAMGGSDYITGHGARGYLDHQLFERSGLAVSYMQYQRLPYAQLHGDFDPYVTALDLIANCGSTGASLICSTAIGWREFLNEPT